MERLWPVVGIQIVRKVIAVFLLALVTLYGLGIAFQIVMIDVLDLRAGTLMDGDRHRVTASETALHIGLLLVCSVVGRMLFRYINRDERLS